MTFFVFERLREKKVPHAEVVSKKVGDAFAQYPNWQRSEKDLRELRKLVTFAICAQEDDLDKVTEIVDTLFAILRMKQGT